MKNRAHGIPFIANIFAIPRSLNAIAIKVTKAIMIETFLPLISNHSNVNRTTEKAIEISLIVEKSKLDIPKNAWKKGNIIIRSIASNSGM